MRENRESHPTTTPNPCSVLLPHYYYYLLPIITNKTGEPWALSLEPLPNTTITNHHNHHHTKGAFSSALFFLLLSSSFFSSSSTTTTTPRHMTTLQHRNDELAGYFEGIPFNTITNIEIIVRSASHLFLKKKYRSLIYYYQCFYRPPAVPHLLWISYCLLPVAPCHIFSPRRCFLPYREVLIFFSWQSISNETWRVFLSKRKKTSSQNFWKITRTGVSFSRRATDPMRRRERGKFWMSPPKTSFHWSMNTRQRN